MFLTFVTFLPIFGALFLAFLPKENEGAIKQTALAFAVADFILSLLLWTNFGNTPGDRDVILASIDLGVNYSHPDLRNNLWQNLGEDADGDGRTIEGSGSN